LTRAALKFKLLNFRWLANIFPDAVWPFRIAARRAQEVEIFTLRLHLPNDLRRAKVRGEEEFLMNPGHCDDERILLLAELHKNQAKLTFGAR
jgi:hypothetical protein